ncbi:hypothetical protein PG984_000163 [Apiospora sp. TS-2023a]
MEESESVDILFTTKCFNPKIETALSEHAVLSCSRSDPSSALEPVNFEGGHKPIVEIVTVVSTANAGVAKGNAGKPPSARDCATSARVRGRHLIVHSETLAQTIRDVVQFYPGMAVNY